MTMDEKKSSNSETNDSKEKTQLEKYWHAVKENPRDFIGWTYLLQYVEQEGNIENARDAFDAFLKSYPYCYGYWKKYADLERKLSTPEKTIKVFEEGVVAISLSIDLWIHYIDYIVTLYNSSPDFYAQVKRIYERAAEAAGSEFRSDKLWDMYISWELGNKNYKEVTALYDKLLAIPTQLYSQHWQKFQEHTQKKSPKDILSTDEFLRLRTGYLTQNSTENNSVSDIDENSELGEEEITYLRAKIIEKRIAMFKANEEEVSKRWTFEEGIKRPYFHVKPLERSQLRNWNDYLDYEILNGSHFRVVTLFERCLIACALYEDMWIKYTRYLEPHSREGVREVFKRACTIHLRNKHSINMMWAGFEEQAGNYQEAFSILSQIETEIPNLLEASFRKINIYRRMGQFDQVETLYKEYMKSAKSVRLASHFAIKYARFLYKIRDDFDGAKDVLTQAIAKDSVNNHLYMQLMDLHFSDSNRFNEETIMDVLDQALSSNMPADYKIAFAQRKLEFLEEFGSDCKKTQQCFEQYNLLVKSHYATSKRTGEDTEEQPPAKRAKSDVNGTSETPIVAAAVPAAAPAAVDPAVYNYQDWSNYTQTAAAAAAYGYPQAWPGYTAQNYYQPPQ